MITCAPCDLSHNEARNSFNPRLRRLYSSDAPFPPPTGYPVRFPARFRSSTSRCRPLFSCRRAPAGGLRTASALIALAGLFSGLSAAEPKLRLDLPAGDATRTLREFGLRTGEQIIYPAEDLRGVQTKRVLGTLTAREALEQMLAGTTWEAVQDESSGALTVRRRTAEKIVELPLMVVEDERVRPAWRYARLQNEEYLSSCDDNTTHEAMERNFRLRLLLDQFIPPQFRLRLDVPSTYVLFADQPAVTAKEIIRDMKHAGLEKRETSPEHFTAQVLPNFRFPDCDEIVVFFVMKKSTDMPPLFFSPGYIRYLLEHRTPPLPTWFIEGMMRLYEKTNLEVSSLPTDTISVHPAVWISREETDRVLRHGIKREVDFLPFEEVFSAPPPARDFLDHSWRYRVWQSQAGLFIRWAFEQHREGRRQQLWNFLERACERPVTERDFSECFGLSYKDMAVRLAAYVPRAANAGFSLSTAGMTAEIPVAETVPASAAQVARIKGNLERLEVGYVKQIYPALVPQYRAQARRTLDKARALAPGDPQVAAVTGLYECDAGNDAAAEPLLELAAKSGIVRPRVYFELARIKFDALRRAHPNERFTPDQAAELLQLLFSARTQSPPLVQVYELIGEVWRRSSVLPQRGHLAVLDEGIRLFPDDLELIYAAAVLNADSGFDMVAGNLVDMGLRKSSGDASRDRFLRLQAAMKRQ